MVHSLSYMCVCVKVAPYPETKNSAEMWLIRTMKRIIIGREGSINFTEILGLANTMIIIMAEMAVV